MTQDPTVLLAEESTRGEDSEAADRVMDRGRPVGSLDVAANDDLPSLAAEIAATREETRSAA